MICRTGQRCRIPTSTRGSRRRHSSLAASRIRRPRRHCRPLWVVSNRALIVMTRPEWTGAGPALQAGWRARERGRRVPCDTPSVMTHLTECVIGGQLAPWRSVSRWCVGREERKAAAEEGEEPKSWRADGARCSAIAVQQHRQQVNYRLR